MRHVCVAMTILSVNAEDTVFPGTESFPEEVEEEFEGDLRA